MIKLLEAAYDSYRIYLAISGVLDVHNAKLALLKWPDVAGSAILLAEKPEDESLKLTLLHDLQLAIVSPIRAIHNSAMDRVKELSGSKPAKAEEVAIKAREIKHKDPIEAKKMLLESIDNMFVVLNTMTNVEYPKV